MKTIWKGSIFFGRVGIPVQLVPATEDHGMQFHQVHDKDGARIRYRRFCEEEDREVPQNEIAKGYRTSDGRTVVLDEEDWASLPLPAKDAIDVVAFVDEDDIDPVLLTRAYYARPDAPASRPYALLAQALARSGRVALARMALRNRETPALLRVRDGVLVLHTMLWPDELRRPEGIAPDASITLRPKELRLAGDLMDQIGGIKLDELTDTYRKAVENLVAAKVWGTGRERRADGHREDAVDLTAALEQSLVEAGGAPRTPRRAAKAAAAESGRRTTGRTGTAARKSTTAKAAAKKDAAARRARKAP